jgi:hypothetical protein
MTVKPSCFGILPCFRDAWSFVVIRGHSWSFVVIRGHSSAFIENIIITYSS